MIREQLGQDLFAAARKVKATGQFSFLNQCLTTLEPTDFMDI